MYIPFIAHYTLHERLVILQALRAHYWSWVVEEEGWEVSITDAPPEKERS